jgi:hypothetical protein
MAWRGEEIETMRTLAMAIMKTIATTMWQMNTAIEHEKMLPRWSDCWESRTPRPAPLSLRNSFAN